MKRFQTMQCDADDRWDRETQGDRRAGMLLICSDAPDTRGMNQAAVMNAEIAKEMAAIGREELAFAKERQAKFDPRFVQIIEQSLASQKTQNDRSAEQWDAYLQDFRPSETRLAETAANYDTPGRRAEAGASARAAVEREGAMAREAQRQTLGRAGINLSAGRALTLDNASRLQQSKTAVGADAGARRAVEATGMSLTDNVAKTGRGLASTGLQAASLAIGAGGAAGGTMGQQQGTYNASMAPGQSFFSGAQGANASSGNMFGQISGIEQRTDAANSAGLGSLAGAAMTAAAIF